MSPEDMKAWTEFREATGHAPLSDLLAAWKDRQTFLSGLPIAELVTVAFASGDPIAIPSQAFRHAD
jgi:hypothetical protein